MLQRKNNECYVFRVCVCSRMYPACNAHAPRYHLWPVQLYIFFSHYLIKDTIFWKRLLNLKRVLILSTTVSETFLILRGNERDMTKNVFWFSCKVPVILVMFQWNSNVFEVFSKNTEVSDFMKIRSPGAALFLADGRTHMTKLIVGFRNFANARERVQGWEGMRKGGLYIEMLYCTEKLP